MRYERYPETCFGNGSSEEFLRILPLSLLLKRAVVPIKVSPKQQPINAKITKLLPKQGTINKNNPRSSLPFQNSPNELGV